MRSNVARVLGGIAVVAVAVILLIVLKDDGESASEESDRAADRAGQVQNGDGEKAAAVLPSVIVKDGEPVGGLLTMTYKEGDRILFKVKSDTSDEVHVHGYDIEKQVKAGDSVTFDFPATIEGGFEVEMHHGGQIAELIVNP